MLSVRYQNGTVYVIDVSQSVEHDHPHALDFLRADCDHITSELLFSLLDTIPANYTKHAPITGILCIISLIISLNLLVVVSSCSILREAGGSHNAGARAVRLRD